MKHTNLTYKAFLFAKAAHEHIGQKRKYTGADYIVHPVAVAELVATVTNDEEVIAAALLHDTLEDTKTTPYEIQARFGQRVLDLVTELTDVADKKAGNRAARVEINRNHTATISPEAQTVKLADLIDNTKSIVEYDEHFAKTYVKEKEAVVALLTKGNAQLRAIAQKQIANYFAGKRVNE